MSQLANRFPSVRVHRTVRWLVPVAVLLAGFGTFLRMVRPTIPGALSLPAAQAREVPPTGYGGRVRAPELNGAVGYLNTAGPIHLKDLRGKVVLLDFWCFCCINCMHVMPDLARLEKKYANELVVIGIHSAKFNSEKDTDNIRKAVLRYELKHPVVNDANLKIWQAYGVEFWPTFVLIDPDGYIVGKVSSEGHYAALDKAIGELVRTYRARRKLNERPLHFQLAREHEKGDSPLFFPGKILADPQGHRLFIADSTHHRIVITDLDGRKIAIAGTGQSGKTDGSFAEARFRSPQGMALRDETLYVADCNNHMLRALDLKARTVRTIAGTGHQGVNRRSGGSALKTALNSPWDLCLVGQKLYIAMAGDHQIWAYDLERHHVAPYAGYGYEFIHDGALNEACFAQPSGITTDGQYLYVADSEGSAIRKVPLGGSGSVSTIIGNPDVQNCLFLFGDRDGIGSQARLQHALGIAYEGGKLYVADTYNDKIKVVNPQTRRCTTWVGGTEGSETDPILSEPGGLSFAGDKLYIADTNAHRIRVVDVSTKKVSTLKLEGVTAPKLAAEQKER
ncbi:MAG TPA: thioredoxin-like domain-containing protein [Gemmataceae bacterium]|nr:thioredoxin-like domain-containing protein [Gemmataceae bacterium]